MTIGHTGEHRLPLGQYHADKGYVVRTGQRRKDVVYRPIAVPIDQAIAALYRTATHEILEGSAERFQLAEYGCLTWSRPDDSSAHKLEKLLSGVNYAAIPLTRGDILRNLDQADGQKTSLLQEIAKFQRNRFRADARGFHEPARKGLFRLCVSGLCPDAHRQSDENCAFQNCRQPQRSPPPPCPPTGGVRGGHKIIK